MKRAGLGSVQGDEAILRVKYLLQSLVDPLEELIEIAGLIECVDDFRNDAAFGLHAAEFSNITVAARNGYFPGFTEVTASGRLELAPRSVLGPEATSSRDRRIRLGRKVAQFSPQALRIMRMKEPFHVFAKEVIRRVAEHPLDGGVHILNRPALSQQQNKILRVFQECMQLGRSELPSGFGLNALRHGSGQVLPRVSPERDILPESP